jgi:glycosyltransferase involved in cell wall biosynthesis
MGRTPVDKKIKPKAKTLLLVTDTYSDVNGVTTTYRSILPLLSKNHNIQTIIIDPISIEGRSIPCPRYPQLKLKFPYRKEVRALVHDYGSSDYVHIATEGPIGRAFAKEFRKQNIQYTTAYHTNFPKYMKKMFFIPEWITRRHIGKFHSHAAKTFVPNKAVAQIVEDWGWKNIVAWTRGVDTNLFYPKEGKPPLDIYNPKILYVGRISREKNLEEALRAYPKLRVVGDGPMLKRYRRKYPSAQFIGEKRGPELAEEYRDADFFVFPSTTDTFGIVMLEALASGLQVIAKTCPISESILKEFPFSCCVKNLHRSVEWSFNVSGVVGRQTVSECNLSIISRRFTWDVASQIFAHNLVSSNHE